MLLLLLACTNSTDSDSKSTDTPSFSGTLISEATIATTPNNGLAALVSVSVLEEATVTVSWVCGSYTGSDEENLTQSGTLEVWGVPAETDCEVTVAAETTGGTSEAGTLSWTSDGLPDGMPSVSVNVTDDSQVKPGITIVSPSADPRSSMGDLYAFGVDEVGEVVWVYTASTTASFDHYVRDNGDGTLMVLQNGELDRISMAGETLSSVSNSSLMTHHDALPLPDGSVIFLTHDEQTVDVAELGGNVSVQGDELVRVDASGNIVWSWNSFDYLDTQRFPGAASQGRAMGSDAYDWTHANGLALSADGESVIVSFRNQWWLVKIDLDSGEVGWIMGEDGDFSLESGGWFYNQHAPELHEDGSLVLYDNGNERPDGQYSRAVRFMVDENARTLTQVWAWETPSYTEKIGDANWMDNGNTLVTMGAPKSGDAEVIEVTEAGEAVWTLSVSGSEIYRAERKAW